MSQQLNQENDPEMLEEYDSAAEFRFARGANVVVLDPDVAEVFTDSQSPNHVASAHIDYSATVRDAAPVN